MASKAPPSSPGQRETAPSQHQNPSAKEKLQDKLEVKVIKEQLRRERQEQRHEQNKQLWQRRHKEKVRLRHQDLAARIRQQEEDRKEQLYKHEQQQKLVQHLEDRKQNSADQDAADPVSVESDTSAAPQQQLLQVRQLRSKAEVQLALAHQVGEHMSSRAASIEPADGECTPSPGLAPSPPTILPPAGRGQIKGAYEPSTAHWLMPTRLPFINGMSRFQGVCRNPGPQHGFALYLSYMHVNVWLF
ncbi:hypothetical protein WJX77_002907 [Trebouxia sp. C0004]